MKKKFIIATLSALVLAGCTTTKVVKDTSGSKIVDILHAKYAEEVLQAMNRLADSQDMNKVNVLTAYNQNNTPLNKSYSGVVNKQKKIVVPDVYPQKKWRNNKSTTVQNIKAQDYKNQAADDSALTPEAKVQVVNQGQQLTTQNGLLITENKVLREDMKSSQVTAKIAKTESEKELEKVRKHAAEEKAKIEKELAKQVEEATKRTALKIQKIEAEVKKLPEVKPENNPVSDKVLDNSRKPIVIQ